MVCRREAMLVVPPLHCRLQERKRRKADEARLSSFVHRPLAAFSNLSQRADHQTRPRFTASSNHSACFLCWQHKTNELDQQIIVVISILESTFFIKKRCRRRSATNLIRPLYYLVHHGISMLQILIREPVW